MDRKTFLKRSLPAALCSCGAALSLASGGRGAPAFDDCPACTPCEEKAAFAKTWVKRFMDVLDGELDAATRLRLMEINGRACFLGAHGEAGPDDWMDVDVFVQRLQEHVGPQNCYRDGDGIRFNYVQNPRGLKIADGYCLCPIVEDGPPDLSATFCHCSVGYVGEMFGRVLGYPPRVELLESLRSGGERCRFLVHLRA